MLDFDLTRSSDKLRKEQDKRKAEARRKLRDEKKAKADAAVRAAAVEAEIRAKKLLEERKLRDEERAKEEEVRRTGGVVYTCALKAVEASGEGDKVTLPPSALDDLSRQDAMSKGPMYFEITAQAAPSQGQQQGKGPGLGGGGAADEQQQQQQQQQQRRRTCAGVLEFVAEEGTVGLPPKVVLSMGFKSVGDIEGNVTVKYVRLPKATWCKVQPSTVGLSQVNELRVMLEHNLRNHATISRGDTFCVWHRGKEFQLEVKELKPEAACTLIDTDMEIDLDLPRHVSEGLDKKREEERRRTLRGDEQDQQAASVAAAAAGRGGGGGGVAGGGLPQPSTAAVGMDDDDDDDADEDDDDDDDDDEKMPAFDPVAHQLAKSEALPPEPPEEGYGAGGGGGAKGGEGQEHGNDHAVVSFRIRAPSGTFSRRFLRSEPLRVLFDFMEAQGVAPGTFQLVRAYPRKVLEQEGSEGRTLGEAGLQERQEALVMERL